MNSTGQVTLNQVLDLGAEGEVLYNQPGTLNIRGDNPIIGKVNFQNVDDTLNITLNVYESFNSDIDNIMPGENGIVNVIQSEDNRVVNSYIRGNIGETNPIKNLVIGNNNGQFTLNFQLDGKVKASKIQVNHTRNFNNFMRLTINNDVTADIEGVSNGSNNFVLTINQGKTVTGAINSIDTASTTINLRGSVTGPITNATTINFDGTGNTRLGSTANTTDFIVANAKANVTADGRMIGNLSYNAAGMVAATKGITGDIDFKGTNGTFSINDGRAIDGAVLSTGGVGGILNFKGNGNVTQNVGADEENSPAIINIQGDDTTNVSLANDVFVGGVNFTNGGNYNLIKISRQRMLILEQKAVL